MAYFVFLYVELPQIEATQKSTIPFKKNLKYLKPVGIVVFYLFQNFRVHMCYGPVFLRV